MTGELKVVWRVEPADPPRPRRHCTTCGESRLFRSSSKIRLNANGRRLDAWLIYKCEACDGTWNLPLLDRAAIGSIAEADLQAMQGNDPSWIRERAFDLVALRRHCSQLEFVPDLTVTKAIESGSLGAWDVAELAIHVRHSTGQRLDRLLARELGFARPALQLMQRLGALQSDSSSGRALKKHLAGGITLRFVYSLLTDSERVLLWRHLSRPVSGCLNQKSDDD